MTNSTLTIDSPASVSGVGLGSLVTVQWEIKHPDLHNFKDCPPWRNKRITSIRKMPTGETCAMLADHPLCPVRVERLLPNTDISYESGSDRGQPKGQSK